jgi:hypothetical protein
MRPRSARRLPSTASSNYNVRASFNPNEDVASTSNYNIDDRVVASITRTFEFIKRAPTSVTAVYEARTGRPYSWVFRGDANGDGFTFNDLFYVPTGPTDSKVGWYSTAERDAFFAFAEASGLNAYSGTYTPRNSERSPWVQTVDLRFSQTIPLGSRLQTELYVNIINFANWFDDEWGYPGRSALRLPPRGRRCQLRRDRQRWPGPVALPLQWQHPRWRAGHGQRHRRFPLAASRSGVRREVLSRASRPSFPLQGRPLRWPPFFLAPTARARSPHPAWRPWGGARGLCARRPQSSGRSASLLG